MTELDLARAEKDIRNYKIPSCPMVLLEINELASSGHADAEDYAHSISKDVALAGMVLKTVNSPLFGLKSKILSIEKAIVLLGIKRIEKLVFYTELRRATSGKASISLERFWDNTMEISSIMVTLPNYLKLNSSVKQEDCFSIGLFRDCGIPLLATRFDDYRETLTKANNSPESVFTDIEEAKYQTNHAVIGYFMAKSWHLPDEICALILRHHDLSVLDSKDVSEWHKDLHSMSIIAANIHSHMRYNTENGEWFLEKEAVLGRFHLSDMDYQELHQDVIEEFLIKFSD